MQSPAGHVRCPHGLAILRVFLFASPVRPSPSRTPIGILILVGCTGPEHRPRSRILALGYGIGLPPDGLLIPFAEAKLTGEESRRLKLGARFDASRVDLGVEHVGERHKSGSARPGHALRLRF